MISDDYYVRMIIERCEYSQIITYRVMYFDARVSQGTDSNSLKKCLNTFRTIRELFWNCLAELSKIGQRLTHVNVFMDDKRY